MQKALSGLKFCMCFIRVDIADTKINCVKPSYFGSSSGCTCFRAGTIQLELGRVFWKGFGSSKWRIRKGLLSSSRCGCFMCVIMIVFPSLRGAYRLNDLENGRAADHEDEKRQEPRSHRILALFRFLRINRNTD